MSIFRFLQNEGSDGVTKNSFMKGSNISGLLVTIVAILVNTTNCISLLLFAILINDLPTFCASCVGAT